LSFLGFLIKTGGWYVFGFVEAEAIRAADPALDFRV
jgi:hypothetical protein